MIMYMAFVSLFILKNAHSAGYHNDDHTHPSISKDSPSNFLKDRNILRDREHIKEDVRRAYDMDLGDDIGDLELEFYYFKLHDLDQDGKLDGLELLAAMNHIDHVAERGSHYDKSSWLEIQQKINEQYDIDASIIDLILEQDDLNNDGYLSYLEFAIRER